MIDMRGFPGGSAGKESACSAGDLGSIPGLGRSPGEGNGYRPQSWRIPRTVWFLGSQRVGHDWATHTLSTLGFSGKNTGVACHFLLQGMKVKSESEVAQLYRTLSDPMDCSLPGSSVHGIVQARVLEWVPLPSPGWLAQCPTKAAVNVPARASVSRFNLGGIFL